MTDEWVEWHRGYGEDPTMAERLRTVQARIREVLDARPPGPTRVISACAGDGRDLLGALAGHPRAREARARLVELTPALVAEGRRAARRVGLPDVTFVEGDAGISDAYAGATPADLVLLCGIFGNVTEQDIRATIAGLPELCARGATVIWTRGRFAPDLTPEIRQWFEEGGFAETSFVTIPGSTKSVGSNRFTGVPRSFRHGVRLFTFLPEAERPSSRADRGAPAR
jgi:hypothetical protein